MLYDLKCSCWAKKKKKNVLMIFEEDGKKISI